MRNAMTAIGACGLILTSELAAAADSTSPAMIRQQISDCMTKKMGADRTLSYNDAMRTCKARLQPPKETLASNGAAPPASKSH
jgi:hypothetical protein